jgi:signal transduction histidine kinase
MNVLKQTATYVIWALLVLLFLTASRITAQTVAPDGRLQCTMNLCINTRDAMPNGGRLIIETSNVEFDEGYRRLHTYVQPGSYVLLAVSDTGVGMDSQTIRGVLESEHANVVR